MLALTLQFSSTMRAISTADLEHVTGGLFGFGKRPPPPAPWFDVLAKYGPSGLAEHLENPGMYVWKGEVVRNAPKAPVARPVGPNVARPIGPNVGTPIGR